MNGSAISGRARAQLMRHQQHLGADVQALRTSDLVLSGALAACDEATQREILASYLECLQELRVSLQRLEAFLTTRIAPLYEGDPSGAVAVTE